LRGGFKGKGAEASEKREKGCGRVRLRNVPKKKDCAAHAIKFRWEGGCSKKRSSERGSQP